MLNKKNKEYHSSQTILTSILEVSQSPVETNHEKTDSKEKVDEEMVSKTPVATKRSSSLILFVTPTFKRKSLTSLL